MFEEGSLVKILRKATWPSIALPSPFCQAEEKAFANIADVDSSLVACEASDGGVTAIT